MTSHAALINMIKQQLRTGDILSNAILELYNTIRREAFVPTSYKHFAYTDMQIPLSHHQRMMTPLEEAQLLQALALQGHEVVLEVGTGTGFLTALLSQLSKKVISIDYYADFTNHAKQALATHNCHNVELITGDACRGWVDAAPYDIIVFTGALENLDETHRLQLLPRGKLFAIVGKDPVMQGQLHTLDAQMNWKIELVFETNIPPLIDKFKSKEFIF